jgi:ankyrin repeat protein
MDPNSVAEYRGYTPLHWLAAAAGGERVEMLRALVARGANINARSADGEIALMLAREASGQGDELAEELLAMGAIAPQT